MPFDHAVTAVRLREIYRDPHPMVLKKVVDRVDGEAAAFIRASPFVVLASHGPDGADASPRGGPPGFVTILDEHRLAIGDLMGNNRIDTITNIATNGELGIVFMVPGVNDTLRVNGRATLTTDPDVLSRCAIDGTVPKAAIGLDVEACYLHCGKAFQRSQLWKPETWPSDVPSTACLIIEHLELEGVDPDELQQDMVYPEDVIWETGGK